MGWGQALKACPGCSWFQSWAWWEPAITSAQRFSEWQQVTKARKSPPPPLPKVTTAPAERTQRCFEEAGAVDCRWCYQVKTAGLGVTRSLRNRWRCGVLSVSVIPYHLEKLLVQFGCSLCQALHNHYQKDDLLASVSSCNEMQGKYWGGNSCTAQWGHLWLCYQLQIWDQSLGLEGPTKAAQSLS